MEQCKEQEQDKKQFKFDVIVGNPPYQKDTEGLSTCLLPVYQDFMMRATTVSEIVNLLIPSKWMQAGKGIDDFRELMMKSDKFKYIVDHENSEHFFPEVCIDGGICYFIYSNNHNGKVLEYEYITNRNINNISYNRDLKYKDFDFVIRDDRQLSIIETVHNKGYNGLPFSSIVSMRSPYGFDTDIFNNMEKYKEADPHLITSDEHWDELKGNKDYLVIHAVLGFKVANNRVCGYVRRDAIKKGEKYLGKYNIFSTVAYGMLQKTPPKRILAKPWEICSGTFLNIGPFDTPEEQLSCESYMNTKFFRALLYFHRFQKNTLQETFEFIPLENFREHIGKDWNDQELYNKYGLNNIQIDYIEDLVK